MDRAFLMGASALAIASFATGAAAAQSSSPPSRELASSQVAPTTDSPTPTAENTRQGTPAGNQTAQDTNTVANASTAPGATTGIVVTGSRLPPGFTTPTPVTAVSSEQLAVTAPNNLAEGISNLPAFSNSANANRTTGGSPSGTAGQSLLNLRSLGVQRNLVLLDGQRVIASNAAGGVDINRLPQSLVRTVDVVTGGASAAYGSDAVSGVINFILDTHFEGLKAELQGGESAYSDTPSGLGSIAWGGSLADNRLHIVASAEAFHEKAIDWLSRGGRPWEQHPGGLISNPVAGATPTRLIEEDVRVANADYGGLITNTILKGTQFLPDGTPVQHDYGTLSNGIFQVGGANAIFPRQPLNPTQDRVSLFGHAEYDVAADTVVGFEALYGKSLNDILQYPNYMYGAQAYTIFSGNPYIPASIQQIMTANRIGSFTLGKAMADTDFEEEKSRQELQRYHAFLRGRLGASWHYEAHLLHSQSIQDERVENMPYMAHAYAAADAVINPQTGQIVCRSSYFTADGTFMPGGTGLTPGCVPTNLFGGGIGLGSGPITREAENYIYGTSVRHLVLKQDIADASVRGELPQALSLQGGPIAVAFGATYRKESGNQTSDPISQSKIDCTGIRGCPSGLIGRQGAFLTFDPLPFQGSYSVKEGFLELGVPVFKDVPFAKSLDINGAARLAEYSLSGRVWSWKVGATYKPISDLLFRITNSRDTRAPNLLELFSAPAITSGPVIYKGVSVPATTFTTGNLNLQPEKADTLTAGVVFSPTFFRGFNVSVDWYRITIGNAIAQLGTGSIANQCALNVASACALITVQPSGGLVIQNPYLNLSNIQTRGIDVEAYYGAALGPGRLTIRGLANYVSNYTSLFPNQPVIHGLSASSGRVPLRANLIVTYSVGGFRVIASERFIGAGKYDADFVEGRDINNNHVPSVAYTDLMLEQQLALLKGATVFVQAVNLFNKAPPLVPIPSNFQQHTYAALYDVIGRYVTAGVRVKF